MMIPRSLLWKIVTLILMVISLVDIVSRCESSPGDTNDLLGPHDTIDIIRSRGFLAEKYVIKVTAINNLYLYRIINPLADLKTLNKYPVLYGHGLVFSAQTMVSRSDRSRPRKPILGQPSILDDQGVDGADDASLPFMLSNNNFDVWLFDFRGVNRDMRNTSLELSPSKSSGYWNFSLDDQALTDLPILINFVLAKTNAEKLIYVGYSESTMFMFMLMSSAPEYQQKIAAFVAMAPVAYVANLNSAVVTLIGPMVVAIPDNMQMNFFPQPVIDIVDSLMRNFCRTKATSTTICSSVTASLGGRASQSSNNPHFFDEFLKSTSIRAMKHFSQLLLTKRFGMYDFGEQENRRRYGQPLPPAYDLGKIRSDRIILARGLEDFLSDPPDQMRLIRELGNKPYRDIVIPNYNHFNFVDGYDIVKLVNGPVLTAVYELMYKDGPDILRDAAAAERITPMEAQGTARRLLDINSSNIKLARNSLDFLRNPEQAMTMWPGFNRVLGQVANLLNTM